MLDQLKNLCDNCTLCRLGREEPEVKGKKIDPHVFSNMSPSRYAVYGQNPGFNECVKDEPFVGQAGETFNKEIAKHDVSRDQFYISNVLHCYTPGNRSPLKEELQSCWPLVQMELVFLKPKLIITLGKFAFSTFCPGINYSGSLGSIQKTVINKRTYNIFPIYHPSGMNLSMEVRRRKFEVDVKLLCKLVNHWGKDENCFKPG